VPNLGETVGEKTTNNLLRAIHHIPIGDYSGLFITSVPNGTHDQESRLANSFEYSEQSPDHDKSGEAEAKSMAAQNRRPAHDIDGEEFSDWNALDREIYGVFDDENGDVDAGCEPSPLRLSVKCTSSGILRNVTHVVVLLQNWDIVANAHD
jgi:hypothetical protein